LFFFSAPSSEYQRNHLFCIKANYGEIWQARHRDGAACTAEPHARPTVAGTTGVRIAVFPAQAGMSWKFSSGMCWHDRC
jgi:hypothetical protein